MTEHEKALKEDKGLKGCLSKWALSPEEVKKAAESIDGWRK